MGCQAEHPMPDLFSSFTAATKTKCHDGRRVVLPLLLNCPMRQQRRKTIVPCREIFIYLASAGNKTRDSKQQLHFRQYQI
jgi:hypothetical protein